MKVEFVLPDGMGTLVDEDLAESDTVSEAIVFLDAVRRGGALTLRFDGVITSLPPGILDRTLIRITGCRPDAEVLVPADVAVRE